MPAAIGSLFIDLGLETARFKAQTRDTRRSIDRFATQAKGKFRVVGNVVDQGDGVYSASLSAFASECPGTAELVVTVDGEPVGDPLVVQVYCSEFESLASQVQRNCAASGAGIWALMTIGLLLARRRPRKAHKR